MSKRPMFRVKCTECGSETTVPFKPTEGKPVYCRTCFSKNATERSESHGGKSNRGFGQEQVWARRREGSDKQERKQTNVF